MPNITINHAITYTNARLYAVRIVLQTPISNRPWAELIEGRLALTQGKILTRVSFSFHQKRFLGKFSLFYLEYLIIKL